YSADGVPLWTNRYDSYVDSPTGIAVDINGDVFVTGGSSSTGVGGLRDYATIKYSSLGDVLWINYYDGPLNDTDIAQAIAVDKGGNVFVTGASYNPTDPPT